MTASSLAAHMTILTTVYLVVCILLSARHSVNLFNGHSEPYSCWSSRSQELWEELILTVGTEHDCN